MRTCCIKTKRLYVCSLENSPLILYSQKSNVNVWLHQVNAMRQVKKTLTTNVCVVMYVSKSLEPFFKLFLFQNHSVHYGGDRNIALVWHNSVIIFSTPFEKLPWWSTNFDVNTTKVFLVDRIIILNPIGRVCLNGLLWW